MECDKAVKDFTLKMVESEKKITYMMRNFVQKADHMKRQQALKSEIDTVESLLKQVRVKQLDHEIYFDRYLPSKTLSLIFDQFDQGDIFTKTIRSSSRYYCHANNLKRTFLLKIQQLSKKFDKKIKDEELEDRLAFQLNNPLKRVSRFCATFNFLPNIDIPELMDEDDSSMSNSDSEESV